METLRHILVYIHFIGFALLLGGSITQYLTGVIKINSSMLWGSAIQLITGLALAAPLRGGGDREPDPAKLAVKAVIAILIFIAVLVPRKKERIATGHFWSIVGMTLLNAAVAVFWR